MIKEIENKIGQLQYEISCLGLDEEDLTGVTIRTEELKNLVKKLTIPDVVGRSEQLKCEHKYGQLKDGIYTCFDCGHKEEW